MKKCAIIFSALCAIILASCASMGGSSADDKAIAAGVKAWNDRKPSAAAAYWADIQDKQLNKKYQNYIPVYDAGVAALDSSDSIKSTNETKLLSVCNTALGKFLSLDAALKLPPDVCEKGSVLAAGRITYLLSCEKLTAAKNMRDSATKVYGPSDALTTAGKEIDMVSSIMSKESSLDSQADKARAIESFDDKIAAYDATLAAYTSSGKEIKAAVAGSDVGKTDGVVANVRSFNKAHQDLAIERESAIRDKAYEFKDRIGEEFAATLDNSTGKKNDKQYLKDILAHYGTVQTNINKIYDELLAFAAKYPKDIGKDVIDDISEQKKDLESKIAIVQQEIRNIEEIESRGTPVMPLMIGLFNSAPGSTAESKKSRPAKFSATKVKKDEYWWGMVSIPANQMNDLVVTMKDNRTVRVFNANTKSGKLIEKNNMKNLVSNRISNSWAVLNAGKQLTSNKYFFEVQKGKTPEYEGEVVVYSSFMTRMR